MRVYFNASMDGRPRCVKHFRPIVKAIKGLNHKVFSDHVLKVKKINGDKKQIQFDFQRARESIQKSDVMVMEATYPSIEVGHMMALALEMHKAVLVLYQDGHYNLSMGDPNRLLTVRKYDPSDYKALKKTVSVFLDKANKRLLNKRFNFMIDETEEEYLGWTSKKKGISRADYLRQLIDEDLRKNNP